MGLASSQTRLLSLTSREHFLESQAQYIQAQKLRMANDSNAVYNTYMQALSSTTLQTKQYNSTGSPGWINGSLNNLMRYQANESTTGTVFYIQDTSSGELYVPKSISDTYSEANGDLYKFLNSNNIQYTKATDTNGSTTITYSDKVTGEYFENLFNAIKSAGGCKALSDSSAQSSSWVENMIKNGEVILATYDSDSGELDNTTASSNPSLQEINDDDTVQIAENNYEAANTEIQEKETKYDTRLSQLETEESAIKTEISSLKGIIKDNTEATFKLFNA